MTISAAARAEAARLSALFQAAGAQPVDAAILQPADTLLDLYGEDIRARAYVTHDPLRGELMLRPDFTMPVVQMHMDSGADPARYTYAGEVFRQQDEMTDRPSEYLQVGYEVFAADRTAADAEVYATMRAALAGLALRSATGDLGIIVSAISGLETTAKRKAALMRHIWRPRRFRELLDRYAGRTPPPPSRAALVEALRRGERPGAEIAPMGLRSTAEIDTRLAVLREDADTAPIPATQVRLIGELLSLREKCVNILPRLRDIEIDMPAIRPVVSGFEARLKALESQGVDLAELDYEGSYGRTSLEYYDGFVFGFYAEKTAALPPVATGGRYDALTRVLGQGKTAPAVGAVIRPEIVVQLRDMA